MKVSESRKTDRILVIVAVLIGLLLGGGVILKALGFKDNFKPPADQSASRGKELLAQAEATVKETQEATGKVKAPSGDPVWNQASAEGRDRGFLTSATLVFRRGATPEQDAIIDLYKDQPRLRDKFPNEWLLKYHLQFEYPNVDELDQDEDCFTNLEEYEFGLKLKKEFSPVDKESHPPLHYRLKYVNFEEEAYELRYTSGNPPNFFFKHDNKANKEEAWTELTSGEDANNNGQLDEGEDANSNGKLDPVEPFGKKKDSKRFKVDGFRKEKKVVEGVETEVGIVTIVDDRRPPGHPLRRFEIQEGAAVNLPQRKATFEYAPAPGKTYDHREFEKFTLPDTLAPSYLLKVVDKDKVVIEFEEGGAKAEITIPMGQQAEPGEAGPAAGEPAAPAAPAPAPAPAAAPAAPAAPAPPAPVEPAAPAAPVP